MQLPTIVRKSIAVATFSLMAAGSATLVAAGSASASAILFNIWNTYGVTQTYPGPPAPTDFTLNQATTITSVSTYHWNNGSGTSRTAPIYIFDAASGQLEAYSWAVGSPGQGGVPNADWTASFNVTLGPGTFTVLDGDPSTWSFNTQSGNRGFAAVSGTPVAAVVVFNNWNTYGVTRVLPTPSGPDAVPPQPNHDDHAGFHLPVEQHTGNAFGRGHIYREPLHRPNRCLGSGRREPRPGWRAQRRLDSHVQRSSRPRYLADSTTAARTRGPITPSRATQALRGCWPSLSCARVHAFVWAATSSVAAQRFVPSFPRRYYLWPVSSNKQATELVGTRHQHWPTLAWVPEPHPLSASPIETSWSNSLVLLDDIGNFVPARSHKIAMHSTPSRAKPRCPLSAGTS